MASRALRNRKARVTRCARFSDDAFRANVGAHIRDKVNLGVLRLVRTAVGPLGLGDLPKGATRLFAPEEKQVLDRPM